MRISPIVLLLFAVLGCGSATEPAKASETTPVVAVEPIKVVTNSPFAKAVIDAAIRNGAGKPTGELTRADLEKVTRLLLIRVQITDLKPLARSTKLEELWLPDNQITDLKPLAGLKELRQIVLYNNQTTNLRPLAGLTKLEGLWLEENPSLTRAEIGKLQKALPKCYIHHNATK